MPRKLDPVKAQAMDIERIVIDKGTFEQMHAADRMASEKLDEGIKGFSKALEALEALLQNRLTQLSGGTNLCLAAKDLLKAYDLDGDGFITREEWLGSDAVFDALDDNHDGRITSEEIAVGLGAVLTYC